MTPTTQELKAIAIIATLAITLIAILNTLNALIYISSNQ
jgi:hypothetical protein